MSTPAGQGMQYRQPVQPLRTFWRKRAAACSTAARSASLRGWKALKVARLSSTWSIVDMPERTVMTLGRLATQRRAQEEADAWGRRSVKTSITSAGGADKAPPFTGSIMMRGTPSSSVRR